MLFKYISLMCSNDLFLADSSLISVIIALKKLLLLLLLMITFKNRIFVKGLKLIAHFTIICIKNKKLFWKSKYFYKLSLWEAKPHFHIPAIFYPDILLIRNTPLRYIANFDDKCAKPDRPSSSSGQLSAWEARKAVWWVGGDCQRKRERE